MRPTILTFQWTTTARLLAANLLAAIPAPVLAQQPPPAAGDEAQLIAIVESERPLFDRAKACQQLAVVGTKDAVPALARLLADNRLSHYARYALEPIIDPAVDEALRGAVGELEGDLLIGVINSIGVRRDAKAVDALKKLLGGTDARVAAAAAGALGQIASPKAVRMLRGALADPEPLPAAVADACLTAATVLTAEGKGVAALALYDAVRQADVPAYLHAAALLGAIRARGPDGLALLVEQLGAEDNLRFQVALRMTH